VAIVEQPGGLDGELQRLAISGLHQSVRQWNENDHAREGAHRK
jgi:hypothetical protein